MPASRRMLILGLGGLVASCASPNPDLYVLAVRPGVIRQGAPKTIVVRQIALARYLERPEIVRSSDDYRVVTLHNDWWGEPLGAMILRVLVEELDQRLPGSAVFADNGAIVPKLDVAVEINLQRMDLNTDGLLQLTAQIATDARSVRSQMVALTVRPEDGTTRALVAAMSVAVGQLADAIAVLLTER
ncbi:MAG TPA: PqiC family protein [Rhodopila sp.]|uniref:PqiC family protein n=1 Tax=Rhodopila sp. TaxID=2480087 RepID=UPI002BC63EA7|nr:PqiC family protein [Rhodopila sp.]HVY18180.1 PqiC family protein [Rhodopila sp.]